MQPDEVALYGLGTELGTTHAVSDTAFARAKAFLNRLQVVDMVTLSGTYVSLATRRERTTDGSVPLGRLPPAPASQ